MTGKERALATLAGRRTDRVPVHHLQFSGHAARVILGRECFVGGAYLQWQEIQALWQGPEAHRAFEARCEEDAVAIARACGHDILRLGYPRKTFIGNIPVQVLHRGTRADVVREVMTCLEAAHESGGIIVGCSNMMMPGTPPDNIIALLETIAANR